MVWLEERRKSRNFNVVTSRQNAIDKVADADFERKLETFRAVTKTEKVVHLTLVTSRGLVRNAYANAVQSEVTLDDLFRC